MNPSFSLRLSAVLVLAGAAACGDVPVPTTSLAPASDAAARATTSTTDENITYSPLLARIDASLAVTGAPYRVAAAELRIAGDGWDGVTSTVLVANDRQRSIGAEWVKGDPRRDGRVGVTYAFGSNTAIAPTTRDPDGSNVRLVSAADQAAHVDEAMGAWRALTCSAKPITKVGVPAGTDPDLVDELVLGQPPSQNYAPPADIVQSGWQTAEWFRTLAGGTAGNSIIGVTIPFIFVDGAGLPTDIDRNGKADLAMVEIFYNDRFYWGERRAERRGLLLDPDPRERPQPGPRALREGVHHEEGCGRWHLDRRREVRPVRDDERRVRHRAERDRRLGQLPVLLDLVELLGHSEAAEGRGAACGRPALRASAS